MQISRDVFIENLFFLCKCRKIRLAFVAYAFFSFKDSESFSSNVGYLFLMLRRIATRFL